MHILSGSTHILLSMSVGRFRMSVALYLVRNRDDNARPNVRRRILEGRMQAIGVIRPQARG